MIADPLKDCNNTLGSFTFPINRVTEWTTIKSVFGKFLNAYDSFIMIERISKMNIFIYYSVLLFGSVG